MKVHKIKIAIVAWGRHCTVWHFQSTDEISLGGGQDCGMRGNCTLSVSNCPHILWLLEGKEKCMHKNNKTIEPMDHHWLKQNFSIFSIKTLYLSHHKITIIMGCHMECVIALHITSSLQHCFLCKLQHLHISHQARS